MTVSMRRKRMSEIDLAQLKVANLCREKEVLLPKELNELLKKFSKSEFQTAIKNLTRLGFVYKEGILVLSDKIKDVEPITDNEILSYLIRPEYVDTKRKAIQVGAQFYECLKATGFPAQVR